MKISISIPEWDLSISIEGSEESIVPLVDLAMRTIQKLLEIVKEATEYRKNCDTFK